ncbi:hypothetical protein [Ottowia sp.]|uniref:DUF6976 family protein n=1 Tax=Ottowia sp. TaxID=1898956 RepID=UPI002C6AE8CB|nr:hypothetical protein [Ottowia sp.]HOB65849.1 hypothetical protein [Ottowia sp.]HPZ58692.1 hypothetical protein [Ottowia sp.]HQD46787.1 hypothetical protein [Ottowia sp.]
MNAARNARALGANAGRMMGVTEAAALIRAGHCLSIAGDEGLLRQLPAGHWVGGTIPYFMGQDGGQTTREELFVAELPLMGLGCTAQMYDEAGLAQVCTDGPENGFTLIVIPAFSDVHVSFARHAPHYEDMFIKPLVGWVSGIHLDDLETTRPLVVNGETLEFSSTRAVALHVPLPSDCVAHIDIINLFAPAQGSTIRFPQTGFSADECLVDGRPERLANYLRRAKINTQLPLVADYNGAMINVCVKSVDPNSGRVDFYAPIFNDVEYRFAEPVNDYVQAFEARIRSNAVQPSFACNCVLNYLYLNLEGKKVPRMLGPMTFGEVAYQLLNQTLVYLWVEQLS